MKKHIRMLVLLSALTMLLAALTISAAADDTVKLGIGIVDATGLRLRESPSTDSTVINSAYQDDVVVVLADCGEWYKVIYNLDVGYMYKEYVIFKAVENADLGEAEVNCALVNLRAKPNSSAEQLKQLEQGETVNIIGLNNGWYKVDYITVLGWTTGYIRSDLLDLTEVPPQNSSYTYQQSVAQQLVNYSMNYLGVPYVWGGTTTSGFDCSGFTQYVFRQFGYELYRVAESQMLYNGAAVNKSELQVGELVFFAHTYASNEAATHVGIYIGGDQFIHASSSYYNGHCVVTSSLTETYYDSHYLTARRH